MNKRTIILIFVVIALLAGAGVWKWGNKPTDSIPEPKEQVQGEQKNKNELDNLATEKDLLVLEKVDTSNWKTYRNEEYGFEVKYPDGWFVRADKTAQESFGRVMIKFSNSDKLINKDSIYSDSMMIMIFIYDLDNREGSQEFTRLLEFIKQRANKIDRISIQENQIADLYIIDKKSEGIDETWDLSLPRAATFVKREKYGYRFDHATEIGEDLQRKEISILKKILESFTTYGR